jgi:hypothetical protein
VSGLDVNPHPISFLDDFLLFVCLPSFFVYGFINIMPVFFNPAAAPLEQVLKNILMVERGAVFRSAAL